MKNKTKLYFGIGTISGLIVILFMISHPKNTQLVQPMQQMHGRSIETNSIAQAQSLAKIRKNEIHNAVSLNVKELACAYSGSFSDDMLRFYCSNMVPAPHFHRYGLESAVSSNIFWHAFNMGVRPPTNIIDFARYCIEASAIHKDGLYLANMLEFEATNACYLNVWRTAARKYYVPDYELSTTTIMPFSANTCLKLVLLYDAELQPNGYERIPTFAAVTNHNDLYKTIMDGRKPEVSPGFAYLDPSRYPQEARDWALHFPNPYTRYQQQCAWKGTRATGQFAIVVLEEILKSWDTQPPYLWKYNAAYEIRERESMRKIIEDKKQSIAGARK